MEQVEKHEYRISIEIKGTPEGMIAARDELLKHVERGLKAQNFTAASVTLKILSVEKI